MSTQHTPGPWYIRINRHPETDGRRWGWVDAAPPGGDKNKIPGVNVTWTQGETSEANARLIAAAPENYACNKELAKIVRELCTTYGHPLPAASLDSSDAAIAKATGDKA
jgi:hypothetical protein